MAILPSTPARGQKFSLRSGMRQQSGLAHPRRQEPGNPRKALEIQYKNRVRPAPRGLGPFLGASASACGSCCFGLRDLSRPRTAARAYKCGCARTAAGTARVHRHSWRPQAQLASAGHSWRPQATAGVRRPQQASAGTAGVRRHSRRPQAQQASTGTAYMSGSNGNGSYAVPAVRAAISACRSIRSSECG
jgi:hypothetical protein